MKLPNDLLQKVQQDYVGMKYKDGVFTFPSLDNETIVTVINSFVEWAEQNNIINEEVISKWQRS